MFLIVLVLNLFLLLCHNILVENLKHLKQYTIRCKVSRMALVMLILIFMFSVATPECRVVQ